MNGLSKKLLIVWLVLVVLVIGLVLCRTNIWKGNSDLKIGIVANDGLALVNISPTRRMRNYWTIDQKISLWIPGGLGWYESGKIKRILMSEKKENLAKDIFIYNFGVIPDKVVWLTGKDSWRSDLVMFKNFGLLSYLKYKVKGESLIYKNEEITDLNWNFDEVAVRDFASSNLINSDVRVGIINSSGQNGLANFMSNIVERIGLTVISVETDTEQNNTCVFKISNNLERSVELSELKKIWHCEVQSNGSDGNTIDIVFGSKFSEVLKYSSYVRTQ